MFKLTIGILFALIGAATFGVPVIDMVGAKSFIATDAGFALIGLAIFAAAGMVWHGSIYGQARQELDMEWQAREASIAHAMVRPAVVISDDVTAAVDQMLACFRKAHEHLMDAQESMSQGADFAREVVKLIGDMGAQNASLQAEVDALQMRSEALGEAVRLASDALRTPVVRRNGQSAPTAPLEEKLIPDLPEVMPSTVAKGPAYGPRPDLMASAANIKLPKFLGPTPDIAQVMADNVGQYAPPNIRNAQLGALGVPQ